MSCGLGHFSPALYNFLYISCAFKFKEFPFLLSDTFVHRAKLTSIQVVLHPADEGQKLKTAVYNTPS